MILCDLAVADEQDDEGLLDRPAVSASISRVWRRLLRDGPISRDRLNLDGRRNEIIDVFAGCIGTHAHTHAHAYSNYSYDSTIALLS